MILENCTLQFDRKRTNLFEYSQDVSVPKEVRDLYFISIPRKRSSRRKLIKTRPDLSKNRKVKLYSIAQSWLRSLLHRAAA